MDGSLATERLGPGPLDLEQHAFWERNGFLAADLLSPAEVEVFRAEAEGLRIRRGESYHYPHPHRESSAFLELMKDRRVVAPVEALLGGTVDAVQSWIYFKPPGELGRDAHQETFYVHCNRERAYLNVSIALDDVDGENGGVWFCPGSHREDCLPIAIDEERLRTNPPTSPSERGKPTVIPGNWIDGEWVEKYEQVCPSLRAGQIVFISANVIHGSGPNGSAERWRRSFLAGYARQGAYLNPGSHMKRHRIPLS